MSYAFSDGLVLVALIAVLGSAAAIRLAGMFSSGGELTVQWTSDTARPNMNGNHHAPAAARIGDRGMIFVPVSGAGRTDACDLVALDASNGNTTWKYPIPPANCTIHLCNSIL